MENPITMDDLGVPLFSETPTWRIIPGVRYVANNNGDRISPLTGVIPLPKWPFHGLQMGGTNYTY